MATHIIENQNIETPRTYRVWGGCFLVSGTTIGAGMLAFPIVSSQIGIFASVISLIVLWYLMYRVALYTYKLNKMEGSPHSISYLAAKHIDPWAGKLATFMLLFLLYALMSAYLISGASLLRGFLSSYFSIPINQNISMCVFALMFAGLICWRMQLLDAGNRILFMGMLFVFFIMVGMLFPHISTTTFIANSHSINFSALGVTIPVLFTGFGFHGSIPGILNYIGIEREEDIKFAFFWGTLIPLIIFLSWLLITVAIVPFEGNMGLDNLARGQSSVEKFMDLLHYHVPTSLLQHLNALFIFLAISTSLIGVGLGVFDYHLERLKRTTSTNRVIAGFWAFIVPLTIAYVSQGGFVRALSYAGMALSFTAIILPCAILIKKKQVKSTHDKCMITILMILGVAVIVPSIRHLYEFLFTCS